MAKNKFKRAVSLVMAMVLSLTTFIGLGTTTAFAASGKKSDVYIMELPEAEIRTITANGDTENSSL